MSLIVGLSGCIEQPSDESTKELISDYIQLFNFSTNYTTYYINETQFEVICGFCEYPDNAISVTHAISVPVKNIADETIDEIKYNVNFYDNESNLVETLSKEVTLFEFHPGNITYLNALISSNSSMGPDFGPFTPYFDQISGYELEVTEITIYNNSKVIRNVS